MDTTEAILLVYGTPDQQCRIITREAAIKAAEQAKQRGTILDYRVEGDAQTGKIYATLSLSKEDEDTMMSSERGENDIKVRHFNERP